jgi:DNA-directed RNA polymerase specialized sigma24 family protein
MEQSAGATNAATDQEIFNRFLRSLDVDRERAGELYESIRRKLLKFFEWRGCLPGEEHADEVLSRMIDKFARGEQIQDPSTYCYGVARLVLLEIRKDRAREQAVISELQHVAPSRSDDGRKQLALGCLEKCLAGLPPDNVELILGYYNQDGGTKIVQRKKMAEEMAIPMNALRIRAHRLRERLERCVHSCLQ